MATKNIVPRATGEGSIGTSVKRWLKGWFNSLDVSGDVDIGGNFVLPDSGTQALRSKNGNNKIFPITSVGDMWQTSSGNWIVDANVHTFRDALGNRNILELYNNGHMHSKADANTEMYKANTTASVSDLTPFISYMNDIERYRVRHDLATTWTDLTEQYGTKARIAYYNDAHMAIGVNNRAHDFSLNTAGTEMSYHSYAGSWDNRLIFGYDANSGDAAIKAYSTGGNTSLRLGTSNGGVYSDQVHMNNLGNIGINTNAGTDFKLVIANNGNLGNTQLVQAATAVENLRLDATNASYTSAMQRFFAASAASAAFYFMQMYSSSGGDVEFSMRGDGNAWADGSWNAGGADFAEYFEWADGNPNNENRHGWSVVMENGKIRKALAPEIPFGVISARPTVVGDAAELKWSDKYLKDDFNKYIMEDYEVVEWTETKVVQDATEAVYQTVTKEREVQATEIITEDVSSIELIDGKYTKVVKTETKEIPLFDEFDLYEDGQVIGVHRVPRMVTETYEVDEIVSPAQEEKTEDVHPSYAVDEVPDGVVVPVDATRSTQQRRKLNPNYDENQEYVPRSERPEWDCVGLMGKLRLVKGEVVSPNWIKMRDVSGTVEEWLVR